MVLKDSKIKVDLSKIVQTKKKKRLGIGSLKDKDDVFVVEYGSEIDEDGNRAQVRLMVITNEAVAAAKEVELTNLGIASRLRKRYSSGITKSMNALERIAMFMGKKKNAKEGDIDSKIWYHFRIQAKRKGFAKLTLVEMYVVFSNVGDNF